MTLADEPNADAAPAPFASGGEEQLALRPGDTLGPYTVARFIARGGMGMVWAASLTGTRGFSKLFALKTILPSLAGEPDYVKVFLDEANVAAQIQHPNVCQVFDFGTERNILYIAMEWIEGPSLGALLKARPGGGVDLGAAVRIVTDACAGLVAVHEQVDFEGKPLKIIHRDVTPQNILVTPDGHAKIADFGVARFTEQTHKKTATGIVKGKASYMAPEHMLASGIDQRCDIFSLGCVLYEVTVGRRPFEGRDVGTLLREVLKGDPKPPRSLVVDYSPRLEAIVLKALARMPDARYPTARAFRRDLEEWLAEECPGVSHPQVAAEIRAIVGPGLGRMRESLRAEAREFSPASVSYDRSRDAQPSNISFSDAVESTRIEGLKMHGSGTGASPLATSSPSFDAGGLVHGDAPTRTAALGTSPSASRSIGATRSMWQARNQLLASLAVAAVAVGSVIAYVLTR